MRALRFQAVALGGATAVLLVLPADTGAFATLGTNLGVADERDVRVHNNFSDPTVNDDQSADAGFPGYFGARRAIWKACVEWGSRLHGNGGGDPHQPGGLGSGGANFDVTWQGSALSVGVESNKIHSQISGSNGGVYAYCETPFTGWGWRIRYYEAPWTWDDGPGPLPGGHTDLQGIATHEFGHALGLAHTTVSGATMVGAVSQSGSYFNRSIESDDISGVRTIYGVASAAKPIIAGITAPTAGVVEIAGSGFHATNNEVWFTRAVASAGTIDPIKATGVPSTAAGTLIAVGVPFGAGSGDLLVKIPGTQHHTLSNAWPFDADLFACTWSNFCVAMPNSTGVGATMTVVGTTRISDNNFALNLSGLPVGTIGIFYTGNQQTAGVPFGNGVNCITGQVLRFGVSHADALGGFVRPIPFGSYPGNQMEADGTPWYFQFWYRNPAGGGAGYNTSDGVCVVFCP